MTTVRNSANTSNSYILTDSGRVAMAKAIQSQTMHMACGGLIPPIDNPELKTAKYTSGSGTLTRGEYFYAVSANNDFGSTEISNVMSDTVVDNNSIITLTFTTVAKNVTIFRKNSVGETFTPIAKVDVNETGTITFVDDGSYGVLQIPVPVSNTTGYVNWGENPPIAGTNFSKLFDEFGRKHIPVKKFVIPDPNGVIETKKGTWTVVDYPTKWLYVQASFGLQDATDKVIYQFGVFLGTEVKKEFESLSYLLPNHISDFGEMLAITNVSPIYRNAATKEIQELVITF